MKKIILLCFLALAVSCNSDDGAEGQKETFTYTFIENSRIQVDTTTNGEEQEILIATVATGDSLVFKYQYSKEADPQIADSGFGKLIMFQVHPEASSFTYTDAELLTHKTFYEAFCFCQADGYLPVALGNISGNRLSDGNWDIDIDIHWEANGQLVPEQASGIFKPE